MATRLTLALDADLLRAARELARERNTSVNQMVRRFLEHLARELDPEKAIAAAKEEFYALPRR